MNRLVRSLFVRSTTLACLGAALAVSSEARAEPTQTECLTCHGGTVHAEAYAESVHQDLACTACHKEDPGKAAPSLDGQSCVAGFVRTDCGRCHENEAKQYQTSIHADARLPIACEKCHADIHAVQSHKGDKLRAAETCAGCHSRQSAYFDSVHYAGLKEGNPDAATCTDCHGVHTVAKVDNDAKGREFHTRACLQCHDDQEKMERSEVTPIAGKTYFESFHGKNVNLGYPEKVAGCADCHTAHGARKASDPESSVNPAHLQATCSQCHTGASESFVKYDPHAEDTDRARDPRLYWTRIGMTALLAVTFLFFWTHSVLWAFRAFVERQRKGRAAPEPELPQTPLRWYRRFTRTQIAMHIVVIVSFLTLAVTGLPLKFSGAPWAKSIMAFAGGPERARTIHHAAAVLTFGYFATALVMSMQFLLGKGPGGTGVVARLFGPESLFPNRRDLRDLKAMFRWFLFRGPKPTFERWTYWEKFDFLAVFWGMLAIGASGLMLWFPTAAARLLPGWMFNIATIVHSDEALLATGFIFTVHFFNTHLRPEKFPMDRVIFSGRVSHEEMVLERADQWRRYQAEGRADALAVDQPPSMAWELAYRLFAIVAVGIGVALTVAMLWAFLAGKTH